MSRLVALLLVLGSLVVVLTHRTSVDAEEKDAPKLRTDALGDALPAAAVTRLGSTRFVHGGADEFAFSKDDRTLYSISTIGVRAWDVATGKERGSFAFSDGKVSSVATAVSPDGRLVASARADGRIVVRELATGKTLRQLHTAKGFLRRVAFSGRFLLWVAEDGVIRLTDLTDDSKSREVRGDKDGFGQLSQSDDGKLLAAQIGHREVILWETTNWKRLRSYFALTKDKDEKKFDPIRASRLDREGKLLFASVDGHVIAWETDSLEQRYRIDSRDDWPETFTLSPDGKILAVAHSDGINLYQASTGKALRSLKAKETRPLMAFSRDGKTLAGESGSRIVLWDVATGKTLLANETPFITQAGFGKGGREVVTVSEGRITHWNLAGKADRHIVFAHEGDTLLSPCGRYALLTSREADPKLLDTEKGVLRTDFSVPRDDKNLFAFHPDGRSLAVLAPTPAGVVRFFSLASGKKVGELHLRGVPATESTILEISPDGRTLRTSFGRGKLECWELATGKPRSPIRYEGGQAGNEVVASPDGRHVLGGSGPLYLCESSQGRWVRNLEDSDEGVRVRFWFSVERWRVRFSSDSKLVVAVVPDDRVRIWDVASGKIVAELTGHGSRITSLVFSPDGKYILTAAEDGTALRWSVAEALCRPVPLPPRRAPRTAAQLWSDLASDDAVVAETAIGDLATKPDESVKLLTKHLTPAPAVERGRLDKLIQQLDGEEQATRDEASRQLTSLDEQARTAIEAATKSASVEVRRRAEAILARLDRFDRTGAEARPVRAVEALERIGTPAAKKLLTELSRGAADARLTSEAKGALERMRE